MAAYGADVNVPDREILSGRRRLFRAGVQLLVDLLRLEGEADGRQGALLPLLFRGGAELGVHLLHFVRFSGDGRIEVFRGGLDPEHDVVVRGRVNPLREGDRGEEARDVAQPLLLRLVGEDHVLHVRLAFPREGRLQILRRLRTHVIPLPREMVDRLHQGTSSSVRVAETRGPDPGRHLIGVLGKVLVEHPGQLPRRPVIRGAVLPRRPRIQDLGRHARAAPRHAQPEDRIHPHLDAVQLPGERGAEHRLGMSDLHPVPRPVRTAGPPRVDQPDLYVVHGDLLPKELRVDGRGQGHERATETGAERGLRLHDPLFGPGHLGGISGEEVVHRLVGRHGGDRRKHPEGVRRQHHDMLRMSDGAAGGHPRDGGERVGGTGVFREGVVVQVDPPFLDVHSHVFEDRPEHPGRPMDLRLHPGGEADHLGVAAPLEVEDAAVAPAVLVVAHQRPLRIGGEGRLPRSREAEEDRHVLVVAPVAGRAVHRQDARRREQEVHHGEDRLLDLARVQGAADQHLLAPEVDQDEDLAPRPVHLGAGVEAGRADDRELRDVAQERLRVRHGEEHVPGEQGEPRHLGDDADRQPMPFIRAHVAILDEELPPLEVGEEPRAERLVLVGVEGAVRRSPVDRPFASGLPHEEAVVGGPARVFAGPHDEGTGRRQVSFATPQRLLEQRRTREVPPDGFGLPDSVEGEIVGPVPVQVSTQGEPPRCRRRREADPSILPLRAAVFRMAGGRLAGSESPRPLRFAARAAGAAVGTRVGRVVLAPAGHHVGVDHGERRRAVRLPRVEVRRRPGAVPGAVRMVRHHRKVFADEPFDIGEEGALVDGAERQGDPGGAGPARASDPVDVAFRLVREVEVDHVRQVDDVEAPGGDVRRHEHSRRAPLEARQRLLARVLRLVAVDRLGPDRVALELLGDRVGAVLGAGEDERVLDGRAVQEVLEELDLLGFLHEVDPLLHGLGGSRHRGHGHPDRVAKDGVGEPLDLPRHRRREEEGLPLRGELVDDPADVVDEAHVEHPVGLVEDERFDGPQRHESLRHQVEEASGRGDEDVDPPPEGLRLRALVDAAEDDGVLEGRVPAVLAEALRDLGGQLPRRRQHEDADGPPPGPSPGRSLEAVQDREREGGRLPGAGLRAADQVLPLEHDGDRLLLDGGRYGVLLLRDGAEDLGAEPELFERHLLFQRVFCLHLLSSPDVFSPSTIGGRDSVPVRSSAR